MNEGDTNRRDEMYRLLSWTLKAASRGRRVKKGPTPGTRSWSFDGSVWSSFWFATVPESNERPFSWDLVRGEGSR